MIQHFDMNRNNRSVIFNEFFKYDKRELKVRTNIDTLIKTGMYEMAKLEVDKKKQELHEEKEVPVTSEPEIQLVTKKKKNKKLTKKELKELKEKKRDENWFK